ncbi:hypothetical protein GEMRC1_010871 [Eukaryota sp. GEM-RC1]
MTNSAFSTKVSSESWTDLDNNQQHLTTFANCSHCRHLSEHQLQRKTTMGVKVFCCTNVSCQNTTIKCSERDCSSHAKVNTLLRNQCSKCSGEISEWEQPFDTVERYCSLCFTKATHEVLTPNALRCTGCQSLTTGCKSCNEATGRKSKLLAKVKCIACSEGLPWNEILEEVKRLHAVTDDVEAEQSHAVFAQRISNRQNALCTKFKVPHLVLLTMAPLQRVQIACSLNISFKSALQYEQEALLSLEIIKKLTSLSRESYERLPFTGEPNWFKLLHRCSVLLFNNCQAKSQNSSVICDSPNSHTLSAVENELLTRLASLQRYKFSTQMQDDIAAGLDSESMNMLSAKLVASGYSSTASRYLTDSLTVAMKFSGVSINKIQFNSMLVLLNSVGLRSATPLSEYDWWVDIAFAWIVLFVDFEL